MAGLNTHWIGLIFTINSKCQNVFLRLELMVNTNRHVSALFTQSFIFNRVLFAVLEVSQLRHLAAGVDSCAWTQRPPLSSQESARARARTSF